MWKKENFYFEQPDVRFRNELILEILTEDPNYGTESLMFSTVKSINQLSMNEIGVPLIKTSTSDPNADGLIDQINLHIELKSLPNRQLPITQAIKNVKLIGTVDYTLQQMLKLEMIGLFMIDIDTPSGASTIKTSGELDFIQTSPTHLDSQKRTVYNVNPFDDYQKYSLPDILEFYNFRKGK